MHITSIDLSMNEQKFAITAYLKMIIKKMHSIYHKDFYISRSSKKILKLILGNI